MPLLETDAVCFARTSTGDLEFPLRLARGLEAVGIGIRTRLLLWRGEWFLNLDVGVPWLPDEAVPESAAILGQPFDIPKTRDAILREILTTPGVVEVPSLRVSFDGETRELTIVWIARTLFGDTKSDTLVMEV